MEGARGQSDAVRGERVPDERQLGRGLLGRQRQPDPEIVLELLWRREKVDSGRVLEVLVGAVPLPRDQVRESRAEVVPRAQDGHFRRQTRRYGHAVDAVEDPGEGEEREGRDGVLHDHGRVQDLRRDAAEVLHVEDPLRRRQLPEDVSGALEQGRGDVDDHAARLRAADRTPVPEPELLQDRAAGGDGRLPQPEASHHLHDAGGAAHSLSKKIINHGPESAFMTTVTTLVVHLSITESELFFGVSPELMVS